MSITLSDNTGKRYQGVSSDIKPSDVADGTIFHVIDTGKVYLFHDGMWVEDLRDIYVAEHI